LGIADASQIGILFDGVQPQNANNATVTMNDLTLKLYNAAGTALLGTAVLSPEPLTLATNPGNGHSDYLFRIDAAEAASFNALIAGNFSDIISLDSTISFPNNSGGPDSYTLIDVAAVPAPLIGHGLFALLAIGGVLFGGELLERSKNGVRSGLPSLTQRYNTTRPLRRPGRARGPESLHEICENWLPPSTGSGRRR
jgi:hypothetical protein